jgi:short-subunit dehydrogenase
LVGLSEVLRYDLRQHGIGVSVVCPGAVETPLKNTVEILGMTPGGKAEKEMKRRFSNHAVSPERAAELMIRAIQRDQFLVFTSRDIQFIYFCKRHLFPIYHGVMIYISKLLNAGRYPGR